MTDGKTPAFLIPLALAMLVGAVLWFQPYSAEWPGQGYTVPAQRYLRAAIRRDSTALVALSASRPPVLWALTVARTRGRALEAWGRHVEAWVGVRQADTAEVFVFNASREVCPTTPITLRFVGSGDGARVVQASSACLDSTRPEAP